MAGPRGLKRSLSSVEVRMENVASFVRKLQALFLAEREAFRGQTYLSGLGVCDLGVGRLSGISCRS